MPLSQQLKVLLSNQNQATRSGISQQREWQGDFGVSSRAQGTPNTLRIDDEVEDVDDEAEDKKDRRKGEHQERYGEDADGDVEEHLAPYLEIGKVGDVHGFRESGGLR
jgi:hypothetical protein